MSEKPKTAPPLLLITTIMFFVLLIIFIILPFIIVEPRYESLIDEMPCENAETYLDREGGGWVVQNLIEKKLIECNR